MRYPLTRTRGACPVRQRAGEGSGPHRSGLAVHVRFLLLFLTFFTTSIASAALVDRVVAVVQNELVLDSEVRLESDLAARDTSTTPFWDPDRTTARDRLIQSAAIRVVAEDVDLYAPPADAVRDRREAIRRRFETRAAWLEFLQRHGLNEASLEQVLWRRMVTERYLSRNIALPPSDPNYIAEMDALIRAILTRMRVRLIEPEAAP